MILAVIGGGSSQWMRSLMRDVYLMDSVDGGEIRLVDPKTEHVNAVADMLRAFNKIRDKSYEVNVVEDRREAMAQADFVMTTFSPGSMDAFYHDLEVPIRYGIRQPVSMTVGPCGISASLRTAPVASEIVEDMEQVCPGAFLLNVTNPMSVVTWAMNEAARTVKVMGLCHEFHSFSQHVGAILGIERPEGMDLLEYLYSWLAEQGLDYTVAGLNHFLWLTKATVNGEDVLPKIRQYGREHREMRPPGAPYNATQNYNAAKLAYCCTFGYLPLPGDRHLVEFWPSFCNANNGYGMKYNVVKTTVDARRHRVDQGLETIRRISRGNQEVDWTPSGEEMTAIMDAVLTGSTTKCIHNLPNRGQISNLPEGCVVETLGAVSADGPTAKLSGSLPGAVGSMARLHVDVQELTLRAALTGDRDLAVQAMSLDPLSAGADFSDLSAMTDELLLANKQWLPRFFD